MACSNCNTPSCGCSGTYVVSQTCPPACSEVFNSSCIVYTGVDISCTNSVTGISQTVISRNDYLDTALTKIVNFFCGRVNEALTSTVVTTASAPYLTVTPPVAGSGNQIYAVDLDIAAIQAAIDGSTTVVEAGGTNVTVNSGTVGTVTTYTVTAQGTDVVSGDDFIDVQITQNQDDDIATLTLDIAEVGAALGDVIVAEGPTGHVIVTTLPDSPTVGDTTYNLDSISTEVVSGDDPADAILTVVQSGGTAPDYDQVFTVDVDDTVLGNRIMNTAAGILAQGGIIADPASAITVGYDASTHTITIGEAIGVPLQWKTISDGTTDIPAASPNDKLRIVSGTGASVALATGPGANEGTFTITNTDLGSAQSTYTDFACTNSSGAAGGTCAATSNGQALNLVGGDGCDLSVDAVSNTITIDNLVDQVYASVVGDTGPVLTADGIVDQLDVLGGAGINTVGTTGPGGNVLTIVNDGVLTVSAGSNISVDNTDPQNPIVSTRANAVVDASVNQDITTTGTPFSLAHTVGSQYVQIRVIALTVTAGSFVANQDVTSDFAIVMTGVNAYTLTSTTYTGNVDVIVIGS